MFGNISNFINLEKLSLVHNLDDDVNDLTLKEFSGFKKLTDLSIDGYSINGDQDMEAFSTLSMLKNLSLRGDEISLKTLVGIESFKGFDSLQFILHGLTSDTAASRKRASSSGTAFT